MQAVIISQPGEERVRACRRRGRRGLAALAFLAAIMACLPAAAERLSLDAISDYLNGISQARASFTQINADGTISTGRLYIRRPGRARFEYDPPEATLVLASGGELVIVDLKSNLGPDRFPLWRTPLNLILRRKVDLSKANMVVAHRYDGTATTVVAQDPAHPELGQIEIRFTDAPVELRQWVIRDGDGTETTIILGPLDRDVELPYSLFSTSPYLIDN